MRGNQGGEGASATTGLVDLQGLEAGHQAEDEVQLPEGVVGEVQQLQLLQGPQTLQFIGALCRQMVVRQEPVGSTAEMYIRNLWGVQQRFTLGTCGVAQPRCT